MTRHSRSYVGGMQGFDQIKSRFSPPPCLAPNSPFSKDPRGFFSPVSPTFVGDFSPRQLLRCCAFPRFPEETKFPSPILSFYPSPPLLGLFLSPKSKKLQVFHLEKTFFVAHWGSLFFPLKACTGSALFLRGESVLAFLLLELDFRPTCFRTVSSFLLWFLQGGVENFFSARSRRLPS